MRSDIQGGKEYIGITESLCYIHETNTTLQINYISVNISIN